MTTSDWSVIPHYGHPRRRAIEFFLTKSAPLRPNRKGSIWLMAVQERIVGIPLLSVSCISKGSTGVAVTACHHIDALGDSVVVEVPNALGSGT